MVLGRDSACGSMAKFSVLVNSNPIYFFNSSQGPRQGDPLSLLFFIIVIKVLSRMILALVHHGFMVGYLVGDSR